MKEKLKKLLAAKEGQRSKLNATMIESDNKEERAAIGETLSALAAEIEEIKTMLAEIDEPEGDGSGDGGEAGARKFTVGAMSMRGGEKGEERAEEKNKEFRAAWLRKMQGHTLNESEERSIATANTVIPVETSGEIITKIKEICPLLNEIQLLNVAGAVKFAVEGTVNNAALHTENAAISPAADTLVTVSLEGFEIVKLVRISAAVKTMSLDAFEGWLTEQLARKVAEMIENYIINGTGSSQPKGIAKAATWTAGTNSVEWAGAAPTADEIIKIISLLPSRHARSAKFLMNRKAFWTYVMPLRDDKKIPIVSSEGAGVFNVFGYPVLLSDFVADGEIYFGNMRMVVANLADEIAVKSSEASGFAYNAIDYRGTAIFDCDIADAEAFVKSAAKSGT